MAAGHARVEHERTGRRVRITDRLGRKRTHDLWRGLSWIEQAGEHDPEAVELKNGAGCRPYLLSPSMNGLGQARFSKWRARDHVGAIALTEEDRARAKTLPQPFVVLEPHIKSAASPNKAWGWDNWQRLAVLLRGIPLVQVGPRGTRALRSVTLVETRTFREACGVLERASLCILPEGGLHHAAGALRRPAVVLFGGFIGPETTGYAWHVNVAGGDKTSPCGMWRACGHCRKVWKAITPEFVAGLVLDILDGRSPAGADLRLSFAEGAKAGPAGGRGPDVPRADVEAR